MNLHPNLINQYEFSIRKLGKFRELAEPRFGTEFGTQRTGIPRGWQSSTDQRTSASRLTIKVLASQGAGLHLRYILFAEPLSADRMMRIIPVITALIAN